MKKRIVSLLLATLLLVGLLPITAGAASSKDFTIDGLTYTATVKSATNYDGSDATNEAQIASYETPTRSGMSITFPCLHVYNGFSYAADKSVTVTDTVCTESLSQDVTLEYPGKLGTSVVVLTVSRSAGTHVGGACGASTCTRCSTVYTVPHNYTAYDSDGTYHWQICAKDSSHTSDKVACSGGTATCMDKAVCSVCKNAYGEVDPNGHEWDNTWLSTSSHHIKFCMRTANHSMKAPHTFSSTPNCSQEVQCDTCNYKSSAPDAHAWGQWVSNGDGTHTRTCANANRCTENGVCTGSAGICETCGGTYHNHVWTYSASGSVITATCANADGKCPNTNGGTLSLTARIDTYNGTAQPVSYAYSADWAPEKTNPAIQYTYKAAGSSTSETVTEAKNAGFYKVTVTEGDATAELKFDIPQKHLTVTAKDHTVTYGAAPEANGVTYDGFIPGETEAVLGGTLDYDYDYAQGNDAGKYTITPKGLTSDNYNITFVHGKLTVEPAHPTVDDLEFTIPMDHVYSGSAQGIGEVKAKSGVNGLGAVTVTYNGAGEAKNAGVYTVTAEIAAGQNYESASIPLGRYTIAAKELTVTADNQEMYQYKTLPQLTYTVEGLVPGDVLTTEPTLDASTADLNVVGDYAITASGADAGSNYSITHVPGTLKVLRKPSYITYEMRSSATVGGNISPKGTWYTEPHGSRTYTITPDSGYIIADVLVDGKSIGAVSTYTFMDVMKYHKIHVVFAPAGSRTLPFTDVVQNDWFFDHVYTLYSKGIVDGMTPTTFQPKGTLTYGQALKLHLKTSSSRPRPQWI